MTRPIEGSPENSQRFLGWMIAIAAVVLFASSLIRHALFDSRLYDLGIFDQAVYLISQGENPIVNHLGFHILGDHAAFILYPLSVLYWIYPHVSWLLLVQAIALALGAWPMYAIARHYDLSPTWSRAIALSYLLYPSLFYINRFDFHPEVIALPALLWAIWSGLKDRHIHLALSILVVLSCKAVLSLTVAMLGVWLIFQGKRKSGTFMAIAGGIWFLLAAFVIIPSYTGRPPTAVHRYGDFGSSLPEILIGFLSHPDRVLQHLFRPEALMYYLKLLAPVAIALHPRLILMTLPALPMLLINVMSNSSVQIDIYSQYPLAIFPFLLLWAIASLSHLQKQGRRKWLSPQILTIWAIASFLILASYGNLIKYAYHLIRDQSQIENVRATHRAIALIPATAKVLTTPSLFPHLSHRQIIEAIPELSVVVPNLSRYDEIVLNLNQPRWDSTPHHARVLSEKLAGNPLYQKTFDEAGVVIFHRVRR